MIFIKNKNSYKSITFRWIWKYKPAHAGEFVSSLHYSLWWMNAITRQASEQHYIEANYKSHFKI